MLQSEVCFDSKLHTSGCFLFLSQKPFGGFALTLGPAIQCPLNTFSAFTSEPQIKAKKAVKARCYKSRVHLTTQSVAQALWFSFNWQTDPADTLRSLSSTLEVSERAGVESHRQSHPDPPALQLPSSVMWQEAGTRGSSAKATSIALRRKCSPSMQANISNSKPLEKSFMALLALNLWGKGSRIAAIAHLAVANSCLQHVHPENERS